MADRVDVLTGTLGKALGGASGGYASGRAEIVELLRQRSRPYLFSNSVAPAVVAASLAALDLLAGSAELRRQLSDNATYFREAMADVGFDLLPGEHPIIPVMIGDAAAAARLADRLLDKGVYLTAFSYPVVPRGGARIRTQMSAAHTRADLDRAVSAFAEAQAEPAQAWPGELLRVGDLDQAATEADDTRRDTERAAGTSGDRRLPSGHDDAVG